MWLWNYYYIKFLLDFLYDPDKLRFDLQRYLNIDLFGRLLLNFFIFFLSVLIVKDEDFIYQNNEVVC